MRALDISIIADGQHREGDVMQLDDCEKHRHTEGRISRVIRAARSAELFAAACESDQVTAIDSKAEKTGVPFGE